MKTREGRETVRIANWDRPPKNKEIRKLSWVCKKYLNDKDSLKKRLFND